MRNLLKSLLFLFLLISVQSFAAASNNSEAEPVKALLPQEGINVINMCSNWYSIEGVELCNDKGFDCQKRSLPSVLDNQKGSRTFFELSTKSYRDYEKIYQVNGAGCEATAGQTVVFWNSFEDCECYVIPSSALLQNVINNFGDLLEIKAK